MSTRGRWKRSFVGSPDGSPTVGLGLWLAGVGLGVGSVLAFVVGTSGSGVGPVNATELQSLAVLAGGVAIPLALLGTVTLLNDGAVALVAVLGAVVPMIAAGTYVNRDTLAWAPSTTVHVVAYSGGIVLLLVTIGLAAAMSEGQTVRSGSRSSASTSSTSGGDSGPRPADQRGPGTGDADAVEAVVGVPRDDGGDDRTGDVASESSVDDVSAWFGDEGEADRESDTVSAARAESSTDASEAVESDAADTGADREEGDETDGSRTDTAGDTDPEAGGSPPEPAGGDEEAGGDDEEEDDAEDDEEGVGGFHWGGRS